MQVQKPTETSMNLNQSCQLEASITPITNIDRPISHTNQTQQMNAYKNFVKRIEMQQKNRIFSNSENIDMKLQQIQIQNQNDPTQRKNDPNTQGKYQFSDFMERRKKSKKKINKMSQKKLVFSNTQQKQFSQVKLDQDITKAGQQKKKKSQTQQVKGKPYIEKNNSVRKPLVLQKKKQNKLKQPKFIQQIKLKVLKMPQLNSENLHSQMKISQNSKLHFLKDIQVIIKAKKIEKLEGNFIMNPILKTFDTRYFGIDNKSLKYEKMGKNLLDAIRSKYWCYDNIQNQEVYDNFENFLVSDLLQK